MFLGFDFFSGKYSMTPQYTSSIDAKGVKLNDGTYDYLYLSSSPNKTYNDVNDEWTKDTKLYANYEDSLEGGNAAFSVRNTDNIIIKVKEKDSVDWKTIYVIPVNTSSDLTFMKEYNYGKSDTEYDFMIISSLGGVQNSFEKCSGKSKFNGICIADKDRVYITDANVEPIVLTSNLESGIVKKLNDKYPVVISNDESNYKSGTVTACYLNIDDDTCQIITGKSSAKYRDEIVEWLCNKKAKILKLQNGRNIMIRVVDTPSITLNHPDELSTITFNFVEVGDVESEKDLYNNGLSDVLPNIW